MRRLLVVLAVAALAAPPAAETRTIKLGWREQDGLGVMSFTVASFSPLTDHYPPTALTATARPS